MTDELELGDALYQREMEIEHLTYEVERLRARVKLAFWNGYERAVLFSGDGEIQKHWKEFKQMGARNEY